MALLSRCLMKAVASKSCRAKLLCQSPVLSLLGKCQLYQRSDGLFYQDPEEDLNAYVNPHTLQRFQYKTDTEILISGEWPWNWGMRSRLPQHYKRRFIERYTTQPIPVHYNLSKEKWRIDKYGTRIPVQDLPIPLYPAYAADEGLWGGESVVMGLRKRKDNPFKPRVPRIWKPTLHRRVLYSEILDKYMAITVTLRALDLIDQAQGFDHYILKTHEVDLRSKLGMVLKAKMIKTLIDKSMYPNDPKRRDEVYEMYKQYTVPEEELEWFGLTIEEAEEKQRQIEKEMESMARPLKETYAEQLIQQLKNHEVVLEQSESTSWVDKVNPFKSKND